MIVVEEDRDRLIGRKQAYDKQEEDDDALRSLRRNGYSDINNTTRRPANGLTGVSQTKYRFALFHRLP